MQYVTAQPGVIAEGKWREMMASYWDSYYRYKSEFSLLSRTNRNKIRHQWQGIIQQYKKEGVSHLVEDMSFPYGQPRNTLRRPDLIDFTDMLASEVDMKILVLYRNPVSATYSSIRRGFTNNVYEQARIVEDNLIYIDRQLSVIGHHTFRVLPFEHFLATPHAYLEGLANWMEVDLDLLRKGIAHLYQPHSPKNIPSKTRQALTNFFLPDRSRLWNSLCSDKHTIERTDDT